jgi:thiamine biosynthesis lipoprotein
VEVDQTIIDLILFGKEMYTLTDGAVNIAMGSVLSIWHDYREEGTEVPALTLLQNAAQHTDINDVIVDEDASTVLSFRSGMSLDVGAVAKGYAAELVKNEVEEKGFSSGLISVGGNICVIGEPASSEKNVWNIGIQDPDSTNDSIAVIGVKIHRLSRAAIMNVLYRGRCQVSSYH